VTAEAAERNLLLSSRNVPGARVLPASEVNARDVVACSRLLLAEGAYEALVARIGRSGAAR
jgi:ribosomal protein L4